MCLCSYATSLWFTDRFLACESMRVNICDLMINPPPESGLCVRLSTAASIPVQTLSDQKMQSMATCLLSTKKSQCRGITSCLAVYTVVL